MKAQDIIAVMEYVKAFEKPTKKRSWRKKKEEPDLISLIQKREKDLSDYRKWKEDQEKLAKKEEKKEETWWDKMSTMQKTCYVFLGSHLYVLFLLKMIGALKGGSW